MFGGHLAIDLASNYPDNYRATIAVEGALRSAAEYVDVGMAGIRYEFDNPNVNRASTGAAMMLNISPYSPEESVRETQWMYMCGGPGVFAGDLYYYYYDHEAYNNLYYMATTTRNNTNDRIYNG